MDTKAGDQSYARQGFVRSESSQAIHGQSADGNLGSGIHRAGTPASPADAELPRFHNAPASSNKKRGRSGCIKFIMILAALLVLGGATVGILTATKTINWDKLLNGSNGSDSSSSSSASGSDDRSAGSSSPPGSSDSGSSTVITIEGNRVVPVAGATLFGAHLWGDHIDWVLPTPTAWNKATGINGAIFGGFVFVDPTDGVHEPAKVLGWADQVKAAHAAMLLSVEPAQIAGLDMMTDAVIDKVADVAKQINDKGVPLLMRFAHEMNGGWNPWSQKPAKYKATWIRLAKVIKQKAPLTSLVWAPNGPIGYPWPMESYAAKPGTQDYKDMDTNNDGTVDAKDHPFAPFFPGKEWVDWIGGSIFHFDSWPFGKNEFPRPSAAKDMVLGSPTQPWSLAKFAQEHGLPFGAFESSITYYPNATTGPASEQLNIDMKKEWLTQILDPTLRTEANLALVVWFDIAKTEAAGLYRDFTLGKTDATRGAIRDVLKKYALVQAKA